MARRKQPKNLLTEQPAPEDNEPGFRDYSKQLKERGEELCQDEDIRYTALEMYARIEKGFEDQGDRADTNLDYWDMFNCELNRKQFYSGNTKVYVPLVHDAVNARVTRFCNQIFPSNKRFVEVISNDNTVPNSLMALMEHYIRKSKLRTEIVPALLRAGDVEGQYTVYVDWHKNVRAVVTRVKKPVALPGGLPDIQDETDDIEEQTIVDAYPAVEVISDNDLLVLPATADSMEEALEVGGTVSVIRRYSKAKLKGMIEKGEIDEEAGEKLVREFEGGRKDDAAPFLKDTAKELADAAGIKRGARGPFALLYETFCYFTRKEGGKKVRRLYRCIFGGPDLLLSVKRNPLWCDRLPVLSVPAEKVHGSFKGRSKVASCEDFQIIANDAAAEGMDSAAFSMLPIVMTDPEKNPRIGSMILSLAAVWETSPADTQFAQFPKLYEQAFEIINACRMQVFQTLAVNPAMITQSHGATSKKPSQSEVSREQSVDILTTADAVTIIEEGILTPLMVLFAELDHQHRDKETTIRSYGSLGARLNFEQVAPIAMDNRYSLRWFGVEQARNQAAVQGQIAALNVLRGIPPQLYLPYKANYVPVLQQLVENVFGPRLAPEVFQDVREQLGLPVETEHKLLLDGVPLHPHPMDNHQQHIAQHQIALQQTGDPHGVIQAHIAEHTIAMQMAAQQQMMAQAGGGPGHPGAPGGAGKGMPGQPRQGAMNGVPRGGQQPPGMMHKDRLPGVDPSAAPRR